MGGMLGGGGGGGGSEGQEVSSTRTNVPDWLVEQYEKDVATGGKQRDEATRLYEESTGDGQSIAGRDPAEELGYLNTLTAGEGLPGWQQAIGQTAGGLQDPNQGYGGRIGGAVSRVQNPQMGRGQDIDQSAARLKNAQQGWGQDINRTMAGMKDPNQGRGNAIDRAMGGPSMVANHPDLVNAYKNPWENEVIRNSTRDLEKQSKRQRMEDEARAAAVGGVTGSRSAVADMLRESDLRDETGQMSSQLRAQGFNTARELAGRDLDRKRQYGMQLDQLAGNELSRRGDTAQLYDQLAGSKHGREMDTAGMYERLASGEHGRGVDNAQLYDALASGEHGRGMDTARLYDDLATGELGRGLTYGRALEDAGGRRRQHEQDELDADRDMFDWYRGATGGGSDRGGIGQIYSRDVDTTSEGSTEEKTSMGDVIGTGLGVAGGLMMMSDSRLKENVSDGPGLKEIQDLRSKRYNFIGKEGRTVGLMADDVQKVLPEAVRDVGGYKAVDIYPLVSAAVSSVGELAKRVQSLESGRS